MVVVSAFREATANSESEVSAKAQRFFDDYNKRALADRMTYEATIAWVTKNPLATAEYKRALAKVYRDALKEDPDIGYGADAVICGQDFPEMGCEVKRVWIEGPLAFVFLVSRDPKFMHVIHARFVNKNGHWQLDGTGSLSGGAFEAAQEKLSDAELTRRMVGDWQSPRHAYRYSADGTWKMEPNMADVTTSGRWTIRNGFLESPPGNPARALKIRVLNDEVTYQEDQTGRVFRMERIQ